MLPRESLSTSTLVCQWAAHGSEVSNPVDFGLTQDFWFLELLDDDDFGLQALAQELADPVVFVGVCLEKTGLHVLSRTTETPPAHANVSELPVAWIDQAVDDELRHGRKIRSGAYYTKLPCRSRTLLTVKV